MSNSGFERMIFEEIRVLKATSSFIATANHYLKITFRENHHQDDTVYTCTLTHVDLGDGNDSLVVNTCSPTILGFFERHNIPVYSTYEI